MSATINQMEQSVEDSIYSSFANLVTIIIVTTVLWCIWQIGLTPQDVFRGVPFHKCLTKITWPEPEHHLLVKNTHSVTVSFRNFNGLPIKSPMSTSNLTIEVFCDDVLVPMTSLIESDDEEEVCIIFNATRSGLYMLVLKANGHVIRGFPTRRNIHAEDVDPLGTLFYRLRSHTMILTAGVPEDLRMDPHDKFGNCIETSMLPSLTSRISFQLWHVDASGGGCRREVVNGQNFIVYLSEAGTSLCISIAFASGEEGWYAAVVLLDGTPISDGELTIIVLSRNEKAKVDQIVRCRRNRETYVTDLNYFEGDLIGVHGQRLEKPRKVYCYLTDKQLSIREYFLKIFLKRTFSYRLVPATKLKLVRYIANAPVIRLEDGFQRAGPEICLRQGLIMVACFHRILLNKMGGSETFEDKRNFFNNCLTDHHQKKSHKHTPMSIRVSRFPNGVLKSSMAATRSFSDHDWARLFVIEFEGELGVDQGGLRREWFSLITRELFSPKNGLFVQVEEGGSAVMPNSNPPADVKSRLMFRFAGKIVGKCLYESAHGAPYSQYIPVRLAKSFLAQLVGLRVNFRHFADDAPEFYASKVRLIESNNVEDPDSGLNDLTFSEEVHNKITGETLIVDLKPQGRAINVTEKDKMEYLDLLAQYRLSDSIREPVDYFLEGMQSLVPDSLLSLFDESELELLLCGVQEYSLSDLKKNHTLVKDGISSRMINWFWLSLSHFTPEQFAKLLQFTTGSSQLPPGGFAELRPIFQIASAHTRNCLPTAHTCFNMICLSEHGKFKDFEKALLTAITDGAEGFGLT